MHQSRPARIAPPSGVVKINVDATLSKNTSTASAIAVARYEDGRFMGASMLFLRRIVDPEVMESIACGEGMALASDLRADSVRLANDCLNVVKSIQQGDLEIMDRLSGRSMRGRQLFKVSRLFMSIGTQISIAHRITRSSIYAELG